MTPPEPALSPEQCAPVLRALGEPLRLRILSALRDQPLAVCDLSARLQARQYQVSRHLGALHDLGLVRRTREGQRVMYALSERVQANGGDAANVELGCCCVRLE